MDTGRQITGMSNLLAQQTPGTLRLALGKTTLQGPHKGLSSAQNINCHLSRTRNICMANNQKVLLFSGDFDQWTPTLSDLIIFSPSFSQHPSHIEPSVSCSLLHCFLFFLVFFRFPGFCHQHQKKTEHQHLSWN